ncbi:MAG: sensor domain-containing diguanylate cyclase [Clostridiales bacterium]|nr:sensor domain-containing diguanylate cyclase [Clostridiales bacterium]
MQYVLTTAALTIVISILLLAVFLLYRQMRRQREHVTDKEILYRDNQIKKLNLRINNLSQLNSRYLNFMLKIPAIIQRMNSTLKLHDISIAIIELVNDVVITDKVELYLFDASENLLKKLSPDENTGKGIEQEQVQYAIGEDMIGAVAEHRFVMMREHYNKLYSQQPRNKDLKAQLWMAVPIIFKERLLGVIGIGEIENPVGNESDLLRMIADISSVALLNQILLKEAQHKANTDQLTGLSNRNYLHQVAQYQMEKAVREGTGISVILFDIDNFKNYNDTNGHNAGDTLLIELSRLMHGSTRKEATLARYGGEEFIIMLPGISKEGAFAYADRLRKEISQYSFPHKEKQPLGFVSISGGIASFPEDGDSIDKVIQNADKALYRAKSEGKNRVLIQTA